MICPFSFLKIPINASMYVGTSPINKKKCILPSPCGSRSPPAKSLIPMSFRAISPTMIKVMYNGLNVFEQNTSIAADNVKATGVNRIPVGGMQCPSITLMIMTLFASIID